MTKDEALRMAIKTLSWYDDKEVVLETIGYCEEALAEQPLNGIELEWYCKGWDDAEKDLATQEPVGYQPTSQEQSVMHQAMIRSSKLVHKTTPPSREWVGLSDDEVTHIGISCQSLHQVARAIEAKLREKNA